MMRVLFLCSANSARSILFAATLNHLGGGRFEAHSAGSQPAGRVHPNALAELRRRGIASDGARSKSWEEYAVAGALPFDLVITVCDSAASETCPVLFGDFLRAHWGLADPAAVIGDDAAIEAAFRRTQSLVIERVRAFVALPVETLGRPALAAALADIDARFPSVALTGAQA
jgi:arsenate reductase